MTSNPRQITSAYLFLFFPMPQTSRKIFNKPLYKTNILHFPLYLCCNRSQKTWQRLNNSTNATRLCRTFCSLHAVTSSVIYYSTHPRKNLIYLLNLTICTRDNLYIIPSLITILLLCVVSLLPGKSNPGQQVLVQGNQIQHVATMLQGNVDWLIPFLRIQTTVMVSLRYFSCQAIVAVLIIYNNNGNIFCYGMLFLREFGNVFRRRENEAKIKFIYFEITFKRMLFHIWIFHFVLEIFKLIMWY